MKSKCCRNYCRVPTASPPNWRSPKSAKPAKLRALYPGTDSQPRLDPRNGAERQRSEFSDHTVPVPQAFDIADLNRQLLASCREDERRMIAGREQSVGAGLVVEREHLLPLAAEGMDLAQTSFPTVNSLGCAKVLTNAYSAPL